MITDERRQHIKARVDQFIKDHPNTAHFFEAFDAKRHGGRRDQTEPKIVEKVSIEKFDHSGPEKKLIEKLEVDHTAGTIDRTIYE